MRPRLFWPVLLLPAGCLFLDLGVPAPADALACAEQAATGLGYSVTDRTGDPRHGSFTAEKQVLGMDVPQALGVLTATLTRDAARNARLDVDGARYREREPRGVLALPVPRPGVAGPADNVIGIRRPGRHRLPAGEVAKDARAIERQCGGRGERTELTLLARDAWMLLRAA